MPTQRNKKTFSNNVLSEAQKTLCDPDFYNYMLGGFVGAIGILYPPVGLMGASSLFLMGYLGYKINDNLKKQLPQSSFCNPNQEQLSPSSGKGNPPTLTSSLSGKDRSNRDSSGKLDSLGERPKGKGDGTGGKGGGGKKGDGGNVGGGGKKGDGGNVGGGGKKGDGGNVGGGANGPTGEGTVKVFEGGRVVEKYGIPDMEL